MIESKDWWDDFPELKEDLEESDIPYMIDLVNFKDTTKQFKQVAKQKIISLN